MGENSRTVRGSGQLSCTIAIAGLRTPLWLASRWDVRARHLCKCHDCGNPILRTSSANRGSERIVSNGGSTLIVKIASECTFNAFSSARKAESLSDNFAKNSAAS